MTAPTAIRDRQAPRQQGQPDKPPAEVVSLADRRILAVVATQRLVDGSAWLLGGVARGIAALLT